MSADRFAEIERLYHDARTRRPEERGAFLEEACGGDDALRHEVESLLSFETGSEGFLSRPALEEAARTNPRAWEPGTWPTIPGYTVRRVLGEGGMGVVYLAEQEKPFRRLVALKLIKPGMDTRQVAARFETERQALALMDHPNIAAVFDAGSTTEGRPYFVMEYVDGVSITEYCDRARLSTRDRLALFVQVCAAVQHAHQKGVIHRDLKPSNVLVTERDGQPLPKVIDFGTAKAVGGAWNATATRGGQGMVLGTLEYMSPEQAALSADIDTATDVYSLGVLLYELLVGRLPFDTDELRAAGYDEIRRVIRESDPPKPSARVEHRSDKSGAAARARQTDAPGLTRQLRGDLDWITLKALEKDRRRRYATAAAFATDIGRFLDDQPVEARPPSSTYRIRKFTSRHRGAVISVAAVILALVAGLAASLTQYARAEGQRLEAERFGRQADAQRTVAERAAREADAQRIAALTATEEANEARLAATREADTATAAKSEAEYREYVATISAADGDLRLNLNNAARERLLTVPVALRGWEWQHLFLKSDTSIATLTSTIPCVRPGDDPPDAIFGSDNILATGDPSPRIYLRRCETLEIWDGPTYLRSTHQMPGHILAFGPAGMTVIVERRGQAAWMLRVINPATGPSAKQIGPFTKEPLCADVSSDGTRIAVGLGGPFGGVAGFGDLFDVWDVRAERHLLRLSPPPPPQSLDFRPVIILPRGCAVAFSPDSTRLATSGWRAHIWQLESGAEVAADADESSVFAQPIAWSPDGLRLAIGRRSGLVDILHLTGSPHLERLGGNGLLRMFRVQPDWPVDTFFQRKYEVRTVAFSADGTRLLTSADLGVGVWDVALGKLTRVLYGHRSPVAGAIGDAAGQIISADISGQVKIWPPSIAGAVTVLPGALAGFALSADGSVVGRLNKGGGVSVVRLMDMQESLLESGLAYKVAISPGSRLLLNAQRDAVGTVRTFTVQSKTSVARPTLAAIPGCEPNRISAISKNTDYILSHMAISPDGRSFAHDQGRCVIVRDLSTWTILATLHQPPTSMVFRADGSLVIVSQPPLGGKLVNTPPPLRVVNWDWRKGIVRAEASVPNANATFRVVTSADGRAVALCCDRPAAAWIWDGDLRGKPRRLTLPFGTDWVALNSDGSRLASSDLDSTVRVWDVKRGQLLLNLEDDDLHNYGLAFTPDGRIVVGRASGGLTIWETQRPTCVQCPKAPAPVK